MTRPVPKDNVLKLSKEILRVEVMLTKRFKKIALFSLFVMVMAGGFYQCSGQNTASDVDTHRYKLIL